MFQKVNLIDKTTFHIHAVANKFCEIHQKDDLNLILQAYKEYGNVYILGGGSNVLCLNDIDTPVFCNQLKGIEIINQQEDFIYVKVASGEVWHEFVMYALQHNWFGIENLSLIPGTVGAAPIQNIGAYGVEVAEVIHEVEYLNLELGTLHTLHNAECAFGYRDSIFKHSLKGKCIITNVTFKLSSTARINTTYGAIMEELKKNNIIHPTAIDVSNAVIAIRSSKLPNPAQIGNAGSFFKNPTIHINQYQQLKATYETLPSYTLNNDYYKIPAGYLIETAGWKGFRANDYGVHQLQALVLVNYGSAKGMEIWNLSEKIIDDVNRTFNIQLEREVQVWQ
jgi:UDP-N-acetylmuramate dehydrogenase